MVGGMIPIIKHEEIHDWSHNISGMIELRLFITMNVLNIVKKENCVQGDLLGDEDVEQAFSPVHCNCSNDNCQEDNKLGNIIQAFTAIRAPEFFEVIKIHLLLNGAADRGIR